MRTENEKNKQGSENERVEVNHNLMMLMYVCLEWLIVG